MGNIEIEKLQNLIQISIQIMLSTSNSVIDTEIQNREGGSRLDLSKYQTSTKFLEDMTYPIKICQSKVNHLEYYIISSSHRKDLPIRHSKE